MKKQMIAALLTAAAVFASNVALANTITINQSFDLSDPTYINAAHSVFSAGSDSFDNSYLIHVGDTVDLNYSFLPGQGLRLTGNGGTQSFFTAVFQDSGLSPSNTSNFSVANTSFNLLGASGSFPSPVLGGNQSSGQAHIGTSFSGSFLTAGNSVSFTGVHTSFNVTALQGGQSYYNQAYLQINANNIAVTAVPEPETYAMMVAGLGLLAFMQRRKSAKKSIA